MKKSKHQRVRKTADGRMSITACGQYVDHFWASDTKTSCYSCKKAKEQAEAGILTEWPFGPYKA